MRRIIRIFLASSITEFANERMAIENFIRNISDRFEENYDVKIQPLLCENFDDAYSKIRKQEEYNEKIRNSDLCFFIFFTKVGEYTREEFEIARKKFEETGKPKIYTYFKVIKDEQAEQSLYDFMNELDKIFGHYYGTFEHIDTIKLRILLNLKLQEMDFIEIKVDGDACVVDGKEALSLKNVSEFANNSIFQELKAELNEVEVRYFNLKAKYEKGECSQSEEREYVEIATKRQNYIDAIEQMQKNIFNMSLRMCQDEARGEITLRQKEAYRLFEAGDLEGANNILNFAEIKNDYQRRKAIREAEQKKDAQIFIREGRTKIDVLTMMRSRNTRFDEIEEIYDEIVTVAFDEQVELDVILDYSSYLYGHQKSKRAFEIANSLISILPTPSKESHQVYNLIGNLCSSNPEYSEMKNVYWYHKAVESLMLFSPTEHIQAAVYYCNIGKAYEEEFEMEKANQFYLKVRQILNQIDFSKLSEEKQDMASRLYYNLGNFTKRNNDMSNQSNVDRVLYYYNAAKEIQRNLLSKSDKYLVSYARSATVLSSVYFDIGEYEKALACREKYFTLQKKVFNEDPLKHIRVYTHDVLYDFALIYQKMGDYALAKKYLEDSLNIVEKYNTVSDVELEDLMGEFYFSMYDLHHTFGQKEAETYIKRVIEIYESLFSRSPTRFFPYLVVAYTQIINYLEEKQNFESVEYYYKKLDEIWKK